MLPQWLSHLMSSFPSGPQVPTTTISPEAAAALESSFSKPLLSSTLPQGLSARQQLFPICSLPLLGRGEAGCWVDGDLRSKTTASDLMSRRRLKISGIHDDEGEAAAKAKKKPWLCLVKELISGLQLTIIFIID